MSAGNENIKVITSDEDMPVNMSCNNHAGGDTTSIPDDPISNDVSKNDMVSDSVDDTATPVEVTTWQVTGVKDNDDNLLDASSSGKLHTLGRSLEDIHSSCSGVQGREKTMRKPDTVMVFSCSVPNNMTALHSQSAPLVYPHNGTLPTIVGDHPPSRCCTILLEEIVPAGSSVMGGEDGKTDKENNWKLPLDRFTTLKEMHKDEFRKLPKNIRRYYKAQDDLINAFENIELDVEDAMENTNEHQALLKTTKYLSILTFFANLILLAAKLVAAILSGSLSVVSSLIDSTVDLISGALMYWSARAVKYRNVYHYPQGRTRLEPLAIVILSVIMALASVQMIREATEKIIQYTKSDIVNLQFGLVPICICIGTVVVKLILFLLCRRHDSPSLQALALDHRNDILSNSVALLCGVLGYRVWSFADPIGAIVISMYIIGSWAVAGWAQIKMLTGYTARPEFLAKVTWVCLNHHAAILMIDTVRAFHFGCNFIVEVDIVLPESMSVREAHDIAESLQRKIERMPQVERSFVHVDYECDHAPCLEHKMV